jgi:uncharacterized protein YjbI with pentapeptide repeats
VVLMQTTRMNRTTGVLCASLAGLMLIGAGLVAVRLRPYWVAKYRGEGADLRGAVLPFAPLRDAKLGGANLQRADRFGANLTGARLRGVRYDRTIRWPAGFDFDPQRYRARWVKSSLSDRASRRQ